MNIKKTIGVTLLAAFFGSASAGFVPTQPSGPGSGSYTPILPTQAYIASPPQQGGSAPVLPTQATQGAYVPILPDQSQWGQTQAATEVHVHTPDNTASPKDGAITQTWVTPNGETHETLQSCDNEGNAHQIHRWSDAAQVAHETDNWSDSNGNVHQCHRWIDAQGNTHESVQVTNNQGGVTIEHFIRDPTGRVSRVDENGLENSSGANLGVSADYVSPIAVANSVQFGNLRAN